MPVTERCVVRSRPDRATVRNGHHQATTIRENAPHLTQHQVGVLAVLQSVHQKNSVDGKIRERDLILMRYQGEIAFLGDTLWPGQNAHARRHHRRHTLRFIHERGQVGGRITEPQDPHAADVGPERAHLPTDHAPGNRP